MSVTPDIQQHLLQFLYSKVKFSALLFYCLSSYSANAFYRYLWNANYMQGTPPHSHTFLTQFTPHSYSFVIFQILQFSKCPKSNKSINLIDSDKQVLHREIQLTPEQYSRGINPCRVENRVYSF